MIQTLFFATFFSGFLYFFATMISIIERRLHDTGHTLKHLLWPSYILLLSFALYGLGKVFGVPIPILEKNLYAIPIIGSLLSFLMSSAYATSYLRFYTLLFQEGDPEPNQYGPPRKVSKKGKKKKKENPFRFTFR